MTDLKTMNDPTIPLRDLLDLVEKVESRINNYWNFYTIVVLGIGAWIFDPNRTISRRQSFAIIAALFAFFFANFSVIKASEGRLSAIESEIQSVSTISQIKSEKFRKFLSKSSLPKRQRLSGILHIVVDAILIFLVLTKGKS